MGRPRDGANVKVITSIRLDPEVKKKLIKKYGSIQKWINKKLGGEK